MCIIYSAIRSFCHLLHLFDLFSTWFPILFIPRPMFVQQRHRFSFVLSHFGWRCNNALEGVFVRECKCLQSLGSYTLFVWFDLKMLPSLIIWRVENLNDTCKWPLIYHVPKTAHLFHYTTLNPIFFSHIYNNNTINAG